MATLASIALALSIFASIASGAIDRAAVVNRHALSAFYHSGNASSFDAGFSRVLGNGAFAFSTDASGLQSLNASTTWTNTMADWGWHTAPFAAGPAGATGALSSYNYSAYETSVGGDAPGNRTVCYPTGGNSSSASGAWTHGNPHRLDLLALSMWWSSPAGGGQALALSDVASSAQSLDLLLGAADTNATLRGALPSQRASYRVRAAVHADVDLLSTAVTIGSGAASLALRLAFPYSVSGAVSWAHSYDGAHTTAIVGEWPGRLSIARTVDGDSYGVDCSFSAEWSAARVGPHAIELLPPPGDNASIDLSCLFSPGGLHYPVGGSSAPWVAAKRAATAALLANASGPLPDFAAVAASAAAGWGAYWQSGAFLDLASRTADARAWELERRAVLSLYLLRALECGAEPPPEQGLLDGLAWSGKHHGEMRFWHQAHFALWGRPELLARSDAFYLDYLQNASSVAASQGWAGARWPKMTAAVGNRSAGGIDVPWLGLDFAPLPPGVANGSSAAGLAPLLAWESSSAVGPLLVWQQAHVIWLAEAQRRAAAASGGPAGAAAVMDAQAALVFATADFIASFPREDDAPTPPATTAAAAATLLHLPPPLYGGEEMGDPLAISDPAFELVQFGQALDVARGWRVAMQLPPVPAWEAVAGRFAPPPIDPATTAAPPRLYANNAACACLYERATMPCAFPRAGCPGPLTSHPMTAGIVGMLNGLAGGSGRYGVDAEIANATTAAIVANWTWGNATNSPSVWGWDMPLVAISMARLGWSPDAIVSMLLMDVQKNTYTAMGLNAGMGPGAAYLPGNGGTLLALAACAAGFDSGAPGAALLEGGGAGATAAATVPVGFPTEWAVQIEGFTAPFQ